MSSEYTIDAIRRPAKKAEGSRPSSTFPSWNSAYTFMKAELQADVMRSWFGSSLQQNGHVGAPSEGEDIANLDGTIDPIAGYDPLIKVDEECKPAEQGEKPLRSVPTRLACCHACQWLHLWIHIEGTSRPKTPAERLRSSV